MCGILGIFDSLQSNSFNKDKFKSSLDLMAHRGPDAFGIFQDENNAILGHRRLSIIDLNEACNQPFQVDNRYFLVFNGEIYNYVEIRDLLKKEGINFITNGDTEVLLRAYIHWGEDCISRFNGMWAFAIYDKKERRLFCSRDRFGVKPFNYAVNGSTFMFSSEIKSILHYFPDFKKPNYNIIANFCRTGTGAQFSETWFEGVYRLKPAHNLIVDAQGVTEKRYWNYPVKINHHITFNEALKEYKQLFESAVKLRMRSDVPVGFTLSSGLDSSSIVSSLENNFSTNRNTYTASFNKDEYRRSEKKNFKNDIEINEADIVRKLTNTLELQPHFVDIDYTDYVKHMSSIVYHLESGHNSPAVYPFYKIMERANKDVVVLLEGQGADELLAGYVINFYPTYIYSLFTSFKLRKAYQSAKTFFKVYSITNALMLLVRRSSFSLIKNLYYRISGIQSFFKGPLKDYEALNDYPLNKNDFDNKLNLELYQSHTGGLVNLLHYGDAISMAWSLESRLPFMDYRLVEYVFTLPPEFKLQNGFGKYIHRKAMEGIVPDFILNNPLKFGFDSPLAHIFSQVGKDSPESILTSQKSKNRGIFNEKMIQKAFDNLRNGRNDESRLLYRLLCVELWFRNFIDKNS
jgi:asparagine synthase (glutamine-hydrolysing)